MHVWAQGDTLIRFCWVWAKQQRKLQMNSVWGDVLCWNRFVLFKNFLTHFCSAWQSLKAKPAPWNCNPRAMVSFLTFQKCNFEWSSDKKVPCPVFFIPLQTYSPKRNGSIFAQTLNFSFSTLSEKSLASGWFRRPCVAVLCRLRLSYVADWSWLHNFVSEWEGGLEFTWLTHYSVTLSCVRSAVLYVCVCVCLCACVNNWLYI